MVNRPSLIGRGVVRQDGVEKVTGSAIYVADVRLPGMLEGRILRSAYPHAQIVAIDTSEAEKLPGVHAVVTRDDTPRRKWGSTIADQYPLAVDKVRYVGDEIAAVAALDGDTADEAISLIRVEYDPLPAVFDPIEAMRSDAPLIHDDHEGNIALHSRIERGDPDAAFAGSDLVLEETFTSQHQWHAAIETIGCVADVSASGHLTVWLNTATIFLARQRIAWALDLAEDDVRVIQPMVGGAFGGKSVDDNAVMICALLARKSRRPVRIINRREDEFLASRPRVPIQIQVKMGFHKDGTIAAKQLRLVADKGAYAAKGTAVTVVAALRHDLMYTCQDVRSELFAVYTNKIPTGAFRGFGNPSAAWAVEQMIDMAAAQLDIDPRDMALRNIIGPNHVSPHGHIVGSCELAACVQRATELIGWDAKRKLRAPGRGLGLALSTHVSGQRRMAGDYDGATVIMSVSRSGRVQITCGEGETGTGAMTAWCQLAAAELGVRYEDVRISAADTAVGPFSLGSFASRSTYVVGNAVLDAAHKLRAQVLEAAAAQLQLPRDQLAIVDGSIVVAPDGSVVATMAEVVRASLHSRGGRAMIAVGSWDSPSELQDPERRYGNESAAYDFTCHAVEVEVDRSTGAVRIVDYVAATDAGTIINPIGATGQIEGGFAQGLGYALTESVEFADGQPINPNFSDYRLPTIADMPPFRHEFVPSYEPTGPMGAKGVGEIAVDPVAPAIANAIFDAVGVRITSLPITPEKILRGLDAGRPEEPREN
jgi:CO/xanthine dehydrogenase Mo-binding subunit